MAMVNDYLSRALARGHIGEREYDAARYWQALESDAAAGDLAAKEKLDGLDLDEKLVLGWTRHQLIRDVLLCEDVFGLPSPLARAAAKRGLNPTTGSRHMKRLARELRYALRLLVAAVARLDVDRRAEERKSRIGHSIKRRAYDDGFINSYYHPHLKVSTPESDEHERRHGPERPQAQKIQSVMQLARERGFRIVNNFDSDQDDRFDVLAVGGWETNYQDRTLDQIEAALKRIPVQQRRKRGARGRAPVALSKIGLAKL
jgi:hypothetical protein